MIVPGMFVCSSFLISVCMFIVSKALLISSATVIVRAGGAIWLNPFATVLFSVCSAVTVECCVLYPCCMGVFGMFAVMYSVGSLIRQLAPERHQFYIILVYVFWKPHAHSLQNGSSWMGSMSSMRLSSSVG